MGTFITGMIGGTGAQIDKDGRGEMTSLILREFLEVPELRFNQSFYYRSIYYTSTYRVKYFSTIADCQNRKIELITNNNFYPKMSKIELNRLVDNNISNIETAIDIIDSNSTCNTFVSLLKKIKVI